MEKKMEVSQIVQGIVWGVVLASTCGFSIGFGIHLWEERKFRKSMERNIQAKLMVDKNWLVKK